MAKIEVKSLQPRVASVWVEVDGLSDADVVLVRERLAGLIETEEQVSDALAKAFQAALILHPKVNPSDVWQHVIYRGFLALGYSDQQWKRISGFALERALEALYLPRLEKHGVRLRVVKGPEARKILTALDILGKVKVSKIDMFIEGFDGERWLVFGVAHVKASIAERIQDDVPASLACMAVGLVSVVLTMDSKSFPPPHGNGVNYGELGGRDGDVAKERPKRAYIEEDGQFDALFSFNLRTPPSPATTPSGKRIHTLALVGEQPDALVQFLAAEWAQRKAALKELK